jgi:hypothetical protein
MTKKPSRKAPTQTPFDRFTAAAKSIFNLPKEQVQKIKSESKRTKKRMTKRA